MKIKNKELIALKRRIVRNYIRKNPECTRDEIKYATKIKIERIYYGLKDAFDDAGVPYTKNLQKRNLCQQRKQIIEYISKNPTCSVLDINHDLKINVHRTFGSIIKAYKEAGIPYPERKHENGVVVPAIAQRSHEYEREVILLLGRFGTVLSQIKTDVGIVDAILIAGYQCYLVEIKDYRAKNNINIYEIRQTLRYMDFLDMKKGIIICPKKNMPKRKYARETIINNRSIQILSDDYLRDCSTNHLSFEG